MSTIEKPAAFDVLGYTQSPYGPARGSLAAMNSALPLEITAVLLRLGSVMQDTSDWLSKVLVTPAHKEARITAFLSTWTYERYWMGDALLALAHGEVLPKKKNPTGALAAAVMANVRGRALIGFQSTQRLIDCWTLQALLLDVVEASPLKLAPDIEQIVTALERQGAFFFEIAQQELASSSATRKLTRKRLAKEVWPIDASGAQSRSLLRLLPDYAKDLILGQAQALPGLKGLQLRGIS